MRFLSSFLYIFASFFVIVHVFTHYFFKFFVFSVHETAANKILFQSKLIYFFSETLDEQKLNVLLFL